MKSAKKIEKNKVLINTFNNKINYIDFLNKKSLNKKKSKFFKYNIFFIALNKLRLNKKNYYIFLRLDVINFNKSCFSDLFFLKKVSKFTLLLMFMLKVFLYKKLDLLQVHKD